MYEWILILSIFVGPTSPDIIYIRRFPSLIECKEAAKTKSPGLVDKFYSDQCIKVLKNEE